MKLAGNLELINGYILGLHIEEVDELDLDVVDSSRLISFNGSLYFNDGESFKPLLFDNAYESNALIISLGTNWINENLTFNPVPFNELQNVDGLDSSSSLFDVISQLD